MPYYHVTNKEILQALQEAQKQLNNQRKIFRSVLAELQCEKGYLTNGGLHGVVAKDRIPNNCQAWLRIYSHFKKHAEDAWNAAN